MKIDIQQFAKELSKIAGVWSKFGRIGGPVFGAMTIKNISKETRNAGANLGTKYMPHSLKPSNSFNFDSGQYAGKRI